MNGGYAEYEHYLQDELRRVAQLVAAYFLKQPAIAELRSEVADRLVQSPLVVDPSLETDDAWRHCLEGAAAAAAEIRLLLEATDEVTRGRFPLYRLLHACDLGCETEGLSSPSFDALLVCLLEHRSALYRAAFNALRTEDGATPGGLTVGMLAEIVQPAPPRPGDIAWDRLAMFDAGQPLVRGWLLELGADSLPAMHRRAQLNAQAAAFLLGNNLLPAELGGAAVRWHEPSADENRLPPLHVPEDTRGRLEAFAAAADAWTQTIGAGWSEAQGWARQLVLLLYGPSGSPFRQAVQLMQALRTTTPFRRVLEVDLRQTTLPVDWPRFAAQVYREAYLRDAAVFWAGATAMLENYRADQRWVELVNPRHGVLTFLAADSAWDPVDLAHVVIGTFARIELPAPPEDIRRDIWDAQLGPEFWPGGIPAELPLEILPKFPFTEGQIAAATCLARGLAASAPPPSHAASFLFDACRRVSASGLVAFTHRISPQPGLGRIDAVVLASEAQQQLAELDDRIRSMSGIYYDLGFGEALRLGKGLVALFSGPSGTGKTLAAMVLASCSERDLYKVDMAAVVSKYVGETEKNLARVFSEAQSANAMLFFDEADAIFGKRGDVDRAQDRWANMEINFLLQRVEEFAGVVVLATNLRQNIDDAFSRRVQVLIEFTPPDAAARRRILSAMFPRETDRVTPPAEAEVTRVAQQFDVMGGSLKNMAVDAAFRAYREQGPIHVKPLKITERHLVLAAAREYRKLARPVTVASFGRAYLELIRGAGFVFD